MCASRNRREIPQVLVNFQMKPKGGDGSLLELRKDGTTLKTYDYSPTRNQSPQNQLTLKIPA